MREIFKKAHELTRKMVKEYGVDYKTQFALNLSYLLNGGKMEDKLTWKDIVAKLDNYCDVNTTGDWHTQWYANNWQKGELDRTYITIKQYRNGSLRGEKKCGYWDNNSDEYVAFDRYTKVLDITTL